MSTISLTCLPRTPEHLKAALDSFDVEHAPQYQRRPLIKDGPIYTFCNQFVQDACELLGVPLPRGLLARQQIAWWDSQLGQKAGWFEVLTAVEADRLSSLGRPVVATWLNPDKNKSSHVAMLRSPGRITQAGAHNYNDAPLVKGFGSYLPRFWANS